MRLWEVGLQWSTKDARELALLPLDELSFRVGAMIKLLEPADAEFATIAAKVAYDFYEKEAGSNPAMAEKQFRDRLVRLLLSGAAGPAKAAATSALNSPQNPLQLLEHLDQHFTTLIQLSNNSPSKPEFEELYRRVHAQGVEFVAQLRRYPTDLAAAQGFRDLALMVNTGLSKTRINAALGLKGRK